MDRRAWRQLLGGLAAAAALSAAAAVPNPAVFRQYVEALLHRPPAGTVPPTLGMLLRLAFGAEHFWLVLLPTALGLAWAVWYYARYRRGTPPAAGTRPEAAQPVLWDWAERLPVVLFVSYLASPYGWVYDQILFLVPLTQLLAVASREQPRWSIPILAGSLGLTVICLGLHGVGFREVTFAWLAPVTFVLYLGVRGPCAGTRGEGKRPPPPSLLGGASDSAHQGEKSQDLDCSAAVVQNHALHRASSVGALPLLFPTPAGDVTYSWAD